MDGADGAQGPAGPAGPAGAGGSATAVVDVDCGTGGSIQTAIDSATAGIVTINVTGTCTEDLVISRSNLIIDGGVSGSTLITTSSPGIQVFGASNIEISNLTVTAGANQALALDDAQVSLRDTDISSVGITGGDIASYVAFIDHSKLYMTGSTIAHTSAPDDSGGLLVINNSTLVLDDGNTISVAGAGGTETTALDVLQSSAVTRGFTPGATDTISGNDIGLLLEGASSGFLGTGITITGIAEVIGGSYMLVEEMTLTGDLEVSLNSSFYAEADNPCSGTCDINIIGDVELYSGGQLEMEGVDVSGTITVSHSTSVDIYKSELTNIDADGRVSVDGGAIDGTIECRNGGASETVRLSANGATTTVVGLNVVGGSGPSCVNNNGPVDFSI